MRRLLPPLAAAILIGCGQGDGRSAEAVVRDWGAAVNARAWERACEMTLESRDDCEANLRREFATARLTFDGPASHGGEPKAGEEYFSFGGNLGTVFVTAVPEDGGFRVRVEAIASR